MADDFNLDDMDLEGGQEASLDDFFEPASSEQKDKAQGPSVDDFFAPPSGDESKLPMDPSKADQAPPPQPAEATPPPVPAEAVGKGAGAAEAPGFLRRNLLWIIIGAAVVVLGLGGAYFGMTIFLKPGMPQVATAPVKPASKPSPKKPAPTAVPARQAPSPDKPSSVQAEPGGADKGAGKAPAEPADKQPAKEPAAVKTITPKPEPGAAVKAPLAKPAGEPAPSPSPPVKSTGGPYMVQVGAYMLEASKIEPERRLKELGYADFHYEPLRRTIKIYHVLVGENLTRDKALEIMNKLSGLGYKPQIQNDSGGYKVLAYSYGSYSTAKSTRSKIQRAGLSPVMIKSETKSVTMDQLRVGGYKNRTEANKTLRHLKNSGFPGAIVVKK